MGWGTTAGMVHCCWGSGLQLGWWTTVRVVDYTSVVMHYCWDGALLLGWWITVGVVDYS